MQKEFRAPWIFLPIALGCIVLYFRGQEESLLLGFLYAAIFAFRMPKILNIRVLFPLVMLFLFLMVLGVAPTRLFTVSLLYTSRALILFRGLLVGLAEWQTATKKVEKSDIAYSLGMAFEFALSAVLAYSTFKPVSIQVLEIDHLLLGGVFIVAATAFTRVWIPGIIFGALSFYPPTRAWGIMGVGILAVYESYLDQRARSALA